MQISGLTAPHEPSPDKPGVSAPGRKTRLWTPVGWTPHLTVVMILMAITLMTYANSLRNTGFALDNKFIIQEDPRLRVFDFSTDAMAKTTRQNIKLIFTQDYWWPKAVSGLYRPLTTLSFMLNYSVFGNGDQAAGYHGINWALHTINTALVYFLVLVLLDNLWPAFFTGAVFATHPISVESVTNIVGRADQLATMTVLVGFLLYVKSTTVPGKSKVPWLVALMLLTLVGIFCKETAIVVLGVVGLYDITYRLEQKHPNWLVNLALNFRDFFLTGYVALVPVLLVLFIVRKVVFAQLRPPELPFVDNPLVDTEFWTARLTAIKVIGKYFFLLVWPAQLSCDYSFNQIPIVSWRFNTWEDWKAIIALIAVAVVILVAIRSYRRNKAVFFYILFFVGTFLPTSNLFPKLGDPLFEKETWVIGSIMGERFMYLPSIGFAGCLVIAVYAACRWVVLRFNLVEFIQTIWLQVLARSVLFAVITAFGIRSFVRNFDWDNDVTLWTKDVQTCPDSFKTHKSLAYALYETDPEGKNIDRIIAEGEQALAVTERTQIVMLHLGAYYRIKGDTLAQRSGDGSIISTPASAVFYEKSVQVLLKAVPLDHAFNADMRRKEIKRGKTAEQIADIGNHEIYWNLGISYMRLGKLQEALNAYQYMRHLSPLNADAHLSIASVFLAANDLNQAAVALIEALLLDNSRQEALRYLIEIYRQIDTQQCAVDRTQGQPKLDISCPLVKQHMCAAHLDLVRSLVAAKQSEYATQTRKSAVEQYQCDRAAFDQALASLPAPVLQ